METIEDYGEGENKKSWLKILLSTMILLLIFSLLFFYWFIPTKTFSFLPVEQSDNFSLSGSTQMQFYPNLRFPDTTISYKITDCNLQRTSDMKLAFEFISNLTSLVFYPVYSEEEISVSCQEKQEYNKGLWIAGEGGPTNITKAGAFNIITHGQILLLKDSQCTHPNIAIHELLHVLGFDHSDNKNNLMYNVTSCDQTIGKEIVNLINQLYSIEPLPDLTIENASATINGKYLDANISIRNQGFKDSGNFKLLIYADEKLIKELEVLAISSG